MKGDAMKEYTILQQIGEGRTWTDLPYTSLEEAKSALYNKINYKFEGRKRQNYFVDNDFFENINDSSARYYYCILERNVSNWKKYSNVENTKKSNILKFII